ncbi:hypothetical protein OIO90_004879 [Microbotryomycetes sp. JL221]|nr:hypothetical protein OIO90_004879 [Microbotryomycetes sp. JL221]
MLESLPASSPSSANEALARLCETLFNAADVVAQQQQLSPSTTGLVASASTSTRASSGVHPTHTRPRAAKNATNKRLTPANHASNAFNDAYNVMSPGGSTQRCSQCKRSRPLHEFPVRLTTLQPSLVCKSHSWYWTEDKVQAHWAPEHVSSVEQVCHQARGLVTNMGNPTGLTDKWMLHDCRQDQMRLVNALASSLQLVASIIPKRKSRAVKTEALETAAYKLAPARPINGDLNFRLTITTHEAQDKLVLMLKAETKGRTVGPWSKKKGSSAQTPRDESDRLTEDSALKAGTHMQARPSPAPLSQAHSSRQQHDHIMPHIDPTQLAQRQPIVPATDFAPTPAPMPKKKKKRIEPITRPLPSTHGEYGDLQVCDGGRYDPKAAQTVPPTQRRQPQPQAETTLKHVRPLNQNVNKASPDSLTVSLSDVSRGSAALQAQPSTSVNILPDSSNRVELSNDLQAPPAPKLSQKLSHSRSHVPPMSLADLLASPYTDPPNIPLRQRSMIMNAAAYITASLDQHDREREQRERDRQQQVVDSNRQKQMNHTMDVHVPSSLTTIVEEDSLAPLDRENRRRSSRNEGQAFNEGIVRQAQVKSTINDNAAGQKRQRKRRERDDDLDEWLVRDVSDEDDVGQEGDDDDEEEDSEIDDDDDSILDEIDVNEGGRKGFFVDDHTNDDLRHDAGTLHNSMHKGSDQSPVTDDGQEDEHDESEFEDDKDEQDEEEEETDSSDEERDGEDWLTGFVKGQMQTQGDDEVDELEEEP